MTNNKPPMFDPSAVIDPEANAEHPQIGMRIFQPLNSVNDAQAYSTLKITDAEYQRYQYQAEATKGTNQS